jgi:ornithine carbamoyltransferase
MSRLSSSEHPRHELIDQFARAASVPVVNALSDEHHPWEAIAALLTIRERFGRLEGLKVAYVGDGNSVATSLVEAAAMAGMRVAVASPPGYGLLPGSWRKQRSKQLRVAATSP